MGIAGERRITELRYRRSRSQTETRAIRYLTSIIPALLSAFSFEIFRWHVIVAFGSHMKPVIQEAAALKVERRLAPVASRPQRQPNVRVTSFAQPTRIEV